MRGVQATLRTFSGEEWVPGFPEGSGEVSRTDQGSGGTCSLSRSVAHAAVEP